MKNNISPPQLLKLLPPYVSGELEPQRILDVHIYLDHIEELLQELDELEQNLKHELFPMMPVPSKIKQNLIAKVMADGSMPISKPLTISRWLQTSQIPWQIARAFMWLAIIISTFLISAQWSRFSESQGQIEAVEVESLIIAQAERTIHLASTDKNVVAIGNFYFGEQEGVLFLYGLSPLSLTSHQDYQLWLIQDEKKLLSLGLVELSNNIVLETVLLPLDAQEYGSIGISIEPAGGSDLPTGPVVFWGEEVDLALSKKPLHLVDSLMRQATLQEE